MRASSLVLCLLLPGLLTLGCTKSVEQETTVVQRKAIATSDVAPSPPSQLSDEPKETVEKQKDVADSFGGVWSLPAAAPAADARRRQIRAIGGAGGGGGGCGCCCCCCSCFCCCCGGIGGGFAGAADEESQILSDKGRGPGLSGDRYDRIFENRFLAVTDEPLSTFSIDVDTASYSKARMYLVQRGTMPPPDSIRIEELVNYFSYDYPGPTDEKPFAAHVETAQCPWNPKHKLVRIGIKGNEVGLDERPPSNLVFLIDKSGSMRPANKLPLVKKGMEMLVGQLDDRDNITIVTYAGYAETLLPPTTGNARETILTALRGLQAGGSTAGGAGLELAYRFAEENFIEGGVNRVILCTDGDFNVGRTSQGDLVRQVEQYAEKNLFMSVLAFGMGNHNDAMLEQISNKGNGNYAFIDTGLEARKVLVEQATAALVTIAKDVKIQVEFNPAKIAAYRLIGYENRTLAAEDFKDDEKDAGEIGAGHRVTALYEIVPIGVDSDPAAAVDPLKYQSRPGLSEAAASDEILTVKLRYKEPDGDTSALISFPVVEQVKSFAEASQDLQFAAAVASFGMLLRDSKYKGEASYDTVLEIAKSAMGEDLAGYRGEFMMMVRRARLISESR